MTLAVRAEHLAERMDDPDCSETMLRRTYERFGLVNRAVACWGRVYRELIRPELAALERAGHGARILDIGCGAGDVLHRLVAAARRDGFAVVGVGIDPDARAIAAARPGPGVHFRRAYSRELVNEGATFDLVVSNHLLHHMGADEFDALLADSARLGERLSVHSDIARGRLAYAAFSLGALPVAPGTFLRVDGLTSIRRSYTPAELAERLPAPWRVERPGRFRLLAVHRPVSPRILP